MLSMAHGINPGSFEILGVRKVRGFLCKRRNKQCVSDPMKNHGAVEFDTIWQEVMVICKGEGALGDRSSFRCSWTLAIILCLTLSATEIFRIPVYGCKGFRLSYLTPIYLSYFTLSILGALSRLILLYHGYSRLSATPYPAHLHTTNQINTLHSNRYPGAFRVEKLTFSLVGRPHPKHKHVIISAMARFSGRPRNKGPARSTCPKCPAPSKSQIFTKSSKGLKLCTSTSTSQNSNLFVPFFRLTTIELCFFGIYSSARAAVSKIKKVRGTAQRRYLDGGGSLRRRA
jgi:hypothetical protein